MPVTSLVLPIREYLLVLLTAASCTILLVGPVRILALRLGAVAWPRGRDVHVTPTPRWGGIAISLGVLCGLLIAYQLPALRLGFDYSNEVVGVVLSSLILTTVGALDDRFDLDALTKFAGQCLAAGILVIFGVQFSQLPLLGGSILSLGRPQGVALTFVLTVTFINAMNFIDGLDGLAAGVGAIAAISIGIFSLGLILRGGNNPDLYSPSLIAFALAGACLGFLPHNFNPARIFMGDSGSMVIGVLLAAATTSASGKIQVGGRSSDLLALFSPLLVLLTVVFVPILDLVMAVIRRTRRGVSVFSPDKMHLHHRVLAIGHTHRRAVLLIYLWAGLIALGSVAVSLFDDPFIVLSILGIGTIVAVLVTLIPSGRRRQLHHIQQNEDGPTN